MDGRLKDTTVDAYKMILESLINSGDVPDKEYNTSEIDESVLKELHMAYRFDSLQHARDVVQWSVGIVPIFDNCLRLPFFTKLSEEAEADGRRRAYELAMSRRTPEEQELFRFGRQLGDDESAQFKLSYIHADSDVAKPRQRRTSNGYDDDQEIPDRRDFSPEVKKNIKKAVFAGFIANLGIDIGSFLPNTMNPKDPADPKQQKTMVLADLKRKIKEIKRLPKQEQDTTTLSSLTKQYKDLKSNK